MRTTRIVAGMATLAIAGTMTVLGPAGEAAAPKPRNLAKGLTSPLSAAVAADGTAYVTQNFAGTLTRVRPGGTARTVYASKTHNEVGGVSVRGHRVVFTETASGPSGAPSKSWVKVLGRSGRARTLANIRAFENARNPDGKVVYGARGIDGTCAAQWPTEQFGPPTYDGGVDSHPYATYQGAKETFVADAGMNAVLAISRKGKVRTVAVPPAAAVKITADVIATVQQAYGFELPECAIGLTYYSESVPTDVQQGRDGRLYVTTEGGGLGELVGAGAVYRINPRTGRIAKVAGGLATPVGLAVTPKGDVFVSQLFGGQISRIKHGTRTARPYASVNMPAAVEWTPRGLYVTVDALVGPSEESPSTPPGGRLVRYRG